MKQISDVLQKDGRRKVTVMLAADEQLIAIKDSAHYRLGNPHDDVVAGHILNGMEHVNWCSATQGGVA